MLRRAASRAAPAALLSPHGQPLRPHDSPRLDCGDRAYASGSHSDGSTNRAETRPVFVPRDVPSEHPTHATRCRVDAVQATGACVDAFALLARRAERTE